MVLAWGKKTRACIRLDVNGYLSEFESAHLIMERSGVFGQNILEDLLSQHLHVVELPPVQIECSQPVSSKECWTISWHYKQ